MKTITLTNSDQVALVDDDRYDYVNQWNWQYNPAGYAYRNSGQTILMHRLIMGLAVGDGKQVDHIDGNGLNNQLSNLRVATQAQNMHNRSVNRFKMYSQYKGVTWDKTRNKYKAQIRENGRSKHLGFFDNDLDAARAYNAKAIELFGEFAKVNNI